MARLKASEKYAKNPFAQQAIIHTVTGTRMIYSNPTGDSDRFAAVNKNTGENAGDLQFGRRVKVDKTHFLKFYAEGVQMFLGLKSQESRFSWSSINFCLMTRTTNKTKLT